MANTRSAKKRIRQTAVRTLRNKRVKSAMRTAVRRFREAMAAGDRAAAELALRRAVSMVDRAVTKGVAHRNTAARKKSQLCRSFDQAFGAASG